MNTQIQELETMVEELSDEIAKNFYQTINLLANIASTYDKYYEGSHSRFVSHKSAQIAKVLGMTETEIFEIKIAGLLHDIGKVGMNENILMKFPSEMNGNEIQKYQTHPILGKDLLSAHNGFDTISDIILQHHERVDGSGFPLHLRGEEISAQASILSVVNTFHSTVYKKQKTINKSKPSRYSSAVAFLDASKDRYVTTMNYLHSKSGIFFDKTIVDVFTDIIKAERKGLGQKTIMKLPLNKLKPGMVIAEDIVTNYGLIICYSGEEITEEILESLKHTTRWHEIPPKMLVMV